MKGGPQDSGYRVEGRDIKDVDIFTQPG